MRILLLEDEADLAKPLVAILRQKQYEVVWADHLAKAFDYMAEAEPDLLILDVILPEGEDAGFEFALTVRDLGFNGPILFLTARDGVEDRVRGLDLGGDDYLTKPFDIDEFLARVRVQLRKDAQVREGVVSRGSLVVDFIQRQVVWQGRKVDLTAKEFALLELLSHSPDKVYGVDELVERLFPGAESGLRILRVYIFRLREKIAPEAIETIPGGYRLGLR
ncbi:MAG: response regulator transcription factor [Thermaceae bacterium]|nr:response regulator transcription factor [Thermaceae bacterium]